MKDLLRGAVAKFKKGVAGLTAFIGTTMFSTIVALADDEESELTDFSKVYTPIVNLINSFAKPMLYIVGALGTLYCILLGVKYAKAEEPQDREKAKTHLKNAIIGFVVIFILIAALATAMPILADYAGISLD